MYVQRFNKAAEDVKNMTVRPTDEELKEIYALFKQGTTGDVNTGNDYEHSSCISWITQSKILNSRPPWNVGF